MTRQGNDWTWVRKNQNKHKRRRQKLLGGFFFARGVAHPPPLAENDFAKKKP